MNVILIIVFLCLGTCSAKTKENMTNLINQLFTTNNYNKVIRPINDQTQQLHLYINFFLTTVNELDDVAEKLTTTGYLEVLWEDQFLTWTPSDYGGIEYILVPQDNIWLPDLSLRNGVTTIKGLGDKIILVEINNNGLVLWKPNGVFVTKCDVDIRYFPFDKQNCSIEFGNWVTTKDLVEVELGKKGIILEDFHPNGQWEIVTTSGIALETSTTARVSFSIIIKRKPLYYIVNLVLPIAFLSILVNFTFVLPIDSGEKLGYCITVYLAFAVFLTIISTLLPSGSQTTPLISVYLMILLTNGTVIIMLTTLELRLHFRQTQVSEFYKKITKTDRSLRYLKCHPRQDKVIPKFDDDENEKNKHEIEKQGQNNVEEITWHDVTSNLDFFFFWFFFLFIIVLTVAILSYTYVQSQ